MLHSFTTLAACLLTCLAASSTSSENSRTPLLSPAEKLAEPKYAGGETIFTKIKFPRFSGSTTLPDDTAQTGNSAPSRNARSDSPTRRIPVNTSPVLSPSDEEISPLHSVVEPRQFLLANSPKPVCSRSRGSNMPLDPATRIIYEGMTREELLLRRSERKLQCLYAKAQYSKAKLEYYDIKNYIIDNQL